MKRILLIVAIIIVLVFTYFFINFSQKNTSISLAASMSEITRVTRVIDGDTIEVAGGRHVRYIGINAPEATHCFGDKATEKNISLVNGRTITLVSDVADKDKYGRLLRYVYVENDFVNDELVRQGFAVSEPVKPDTLMAQEFLSAQQEAQKENRGLWNACKK